MASPSGLFPQTWCGPVFFKRPVNNFWSWAMAAADARNGFVVNPLLARSSRVLDSIRLQTREAHAVNC